MSKKSKSYNRFISIATSGMIGISLIGGWTPIKAETNFTAISVDGKLELEKVLKEEGTWLRGSDISVEVDNRGAIAVYMLDSNGNRVPVTTPATTANLSGYVTITGEKVTDFIKVSSDLEEGVETTLGQGNKLTVVSKSESKGLLRKIVLEVSDTNPGAVYVTTSYNSENGDLVIDKFHENEFKMNLGNGPFFGYRGCADQQGGDSIVPIGNGYNHESGQNNYSVGVPFNYVYNANGGLGIGDASTIRREFKSPIKGEDNTVSLGMEWNGKTLKAGEDTVIGTSVIVAATGDYYNGLRSYAEVMEDRGIAAPKDIPDSAYDSRWESWGYEFDFTIEKIVNKLDELKAMGIDQITLDDGWFTKAGDWELNPEKFPNGIEDMKYLTDEIHKRDMTAVLWWRPVDGGMNNKLVTEHPDWFIRDKSGNMARLPGPGNGHPGTAGYALCPSVPEAIEHHKTFVDTALNTWGFDGFKGDYVWGIPKCYSEDHGHESEADTLEGQYKFYEAVYEKSMEIDKNTFIELCNCGTAQDFYSLPYVNHVPTADPISRIQTRTRVKVFKALMGDNFPVTTDHNSVWLPTALGTGSVMITKFTNLSASERIMYDKYFGLSKELGLSSGKFIGDLYKYGIDPLETYVINKDDTMYYSFYKDNATFNGELEIKGLSPGVTYRIEDYVNNKVIAWGVTSKNSTIMTSFNDNLLVRAIPDDSTGGEVEESIKVGNTSILQSTDSGNSKYLNAVSTTLEEAYTVESLSLYVGNNADGGKLRMAIYSDNNGKPGKMLASADEFVAEKNSWNTAKVVKPVKLEAGEYWLVFQPDNDVLQTKTDPTSKKQSANNNPLPYGEFPDMFPVGAGYNTYSGDTSLYATFKNLPDQMIEQKGWQLKYADSQELKGENGGAINAFDGNDNTIWHTKYNGGIDPMPHEIQIDLRGEYLMSEFKYLPRQDGGKNGNIKDYEFYVSKDGINWGEPVSKGTFEADSLEKAAKFDKVSGRYIKLKALSEINGNNFTTVADLKVFGSEVYTINNPLENAKTYLDIPTYDGLNQSTHPDVKYFKDGWNGYKYWMAYTPNRTGSSVAENPSIIASNDGVNWELPQGVINPIAPMPEVGHNCDVDMIYNDITDELWMYWVESDDIRQSWVKVIKSSDGVNWSEPETVVDDSRAMYSLLSPSIIIKDNKYYMWSVNTGNGGWNNQSNKVEFRESVDGENWSEPTVLSNFSQPGSQIWHVDVEYIPSKNEYWAIYPAYKNGTGSDKTSLYYAKSKDGINWREYDQPILSKGSAGSWDDMEIYRSTFIYDEETNMMKVWYGGISQNPQIWKIGYTENNYDKFTEALVSSVPDPEVGTVTTKYVDEKGNDLITPVINEYYVGDTYYTKNKSFDGYNFLGVEGNETGTVSNEGTVVVYKYEKIDDSNNTIIVGKAKNLEASNISHNKLDLTWEEPNENIGIVGYILYKDGKEVSEVECTRYTVEGLKVNTIYGFKVVSKYSNGEVSKPISINVRTEKVS